ncbi:TPA: GPO family capsid scaffolding protein [Vibrio parahaemolyticus]|uniref:GPO family capsid scaffolding protein n=1 Tax=Vibrio parahaemolyticus TaxID=670 RepID=UPI000760FC16|nr:GPO family capsid scaffolding protein [Vibrio parahaemolyticus]KWU34638.1 capsid protein [Vibrio parahaemolyticus]MQF76796.1 capsid protein [Vibrio parahaemolyticus]HCE4768782.1 GPO family capsid scaffolding protein [Vibrio parahaemolyticus]HCG5712509.1 GPO family capsid scaffolding protein [Vibrio parahaemolyticus]HCG8715084.1 GPO family capsid scaffolding protein [Vibrio parahaemolyticus]
MSKTSDWKIVATEGATVDGRQISAAQIKEMGESYSPALYAALIWPEHSRSHWNVFEGNNWGEVPEVKAEKRAGKLRLLAKITPNDLLLSANKKGQKLYTSIEMHPDFQGTGRAYLVGLAVTDSPASTGTTRLKFSRQAGETQEIETDSLEQIDLSEFYSVNPLAQAFATIASYFQSGGELPEQPSEPEPPQEDSDVTEEQLKAALKEQFKEQFSALKGELKTELLEELETKFSQALTPEGELEETPKGETEINQQFSDTLAELLKPVTDKLDGLETKFNKLSQEVPNQEPGAEGAGKTEVYF